MTNQKENNQSVDLSKYKLKNFDIDSIKNMIEEHKEKINNQENEIDVNFDDDENLSLEEIKLYNDLKDTGNLINGLESVLIQTQKIQGKKNSDSWISKAYYKASNIFDETINRKNDISDKNIENYSPKEALEVLEFLNKTYTNYGEAISKTADELAENLSSTDKLSHIDNDAEANIFQEKLIKIVLKKYPNKYIEGFDISDKKVGHYLIKIEDFEKNLKNLSAKDINSKALANYFIHLKNNGKFEKNTLINNIGEKTLIELGKLWKNKKNDSEGQYAKQILQENGLDSIINEVVEINKEYLEIGLNGHNKISNRYYLFNEKEIINITDENKLLEVLKYIKEDITNPNKKKANINEIVFNKNINPSLKTSFNVIKSFYEIQNKELNLLDIKDLNYKNLNKQDIKDLFLMINNNTKITIIGILSVLKKEEIQDLAKDENIGNEIINILKILGNNDYDKNWDKYKFNYNDLKEIKDEKLEKNNNYNDLEKNIILLLNNKLTNNKEQLNKIDNYFSKNIEKNKEIVELFSDDNQTNIINLLPKTLGLLINKPYIIKNIIEKNNIIYTFLPEGMKSNFSDIYIKSLIRNKDKYTNIEIEISKVRINDINQAKNIFSIIENEGSIKMENIIKYSEIRSTISKIINKSDYKEEDKEFIEKFSIILKKYKEEFDMYRNIYEKSELKANVDNNKGKEILDIIYNSKDFYNYLQSINPELYGPIVGVIRINNGEIWEGETLDSYLSELFQNTDSPKEFNDILDGINKIITKALVEQKQNISNIQLKENELNINKEFIKQGGLNMTSIENNFDIFIKNKMEKEGKHIKNIDIYIHEFMNINSLNNLNSDNIERISSYLISYTNSEKFKIFAKKLKDNKELYYKFKSGNTEDIKSLWEEVDEEYYLNLENKIIKSEEVNNKIENKNNNYYITNEESYNKVEGGYNLIGKNGKIIEGLVISEEEKKLTKGNPEATENLVNFYDFFKDLNLEGVWEYRHELMRAIGDININPNDSDSIKEEEIRKFGNKLLTVIGNIENEGTENEKITLSSISSVENRLRIFSGANSGLSDGKTFNIKGEDKFTAYLRNNGIIGGPYFKTEKFREYLK